MQNRLQRLDGESDRSYHKRLVYGKLVDGTLQDIDYTELSSYVYGKDYSSDVARRMMYGSCRTLQLLDAETEHDIESESVLNEIEMKRIELQKERQRFFDQRTEFNKIVRKRARQEELNEIITRTIQSGMLPELEYNPPVNINYEQNELLVSLNDIHYGANVDNYWCKYNPDIFKSMLGTYLDKITAIASLHHTENCVVWANGDLISGNIHHSIAVSNQENVIQQVTGVSELIAEFLAQLSTVFKTVSFVSVAGNHSRIDVKDRALKDERLDDLVEWYLKARLQNFKNIEIGKCEKIDSTMYVMDVRGKTYCGVHGDYDPTPSNIQSLQTMVGRPIYAVLSAHLHHNKVDEVQGIKTMMAGSFLGMDDYCVGRRIYGKPEQLVCVVDASGLVCAYPVSLN